MPSQPATVVCKKEAQLEYVVHVACTFFARLASDLYARSVLIDKILASELCQKFIKSALLVGSENWKREEEERTKTFIQEKN